ncbi:hypothetical protein V8C40DRAFT_255947 [Trichoderma camerunense]
MNAKGEGFGAPFQKYMPTRDSSSRPVGQLIRYQLHLDEFFETAIIDDRTISSRCPCKQRSTRLSRVPAIDNGASSSVVLNDCTKATD